MTTWDDVTAAAKPLVDAVDAQVTALNNQVAALQADNASLQSQLDACMANGGGGNSTTISAVGGDGQVTVYWTAVSGATGYTVGRDGTDTNGTGPWSTVDGPTVTSRVFNNLINDTAYTFTVHPEGFSPSAPTASVTVTPSGGTAPPPGGSGGAWLSGVGDTNGAMWTTPGWTSFRGELTTYARVWGDSDLSNIQNQWMFQDVAANGYDQSIDVAVGGPLNGWADAASGGWDSVWRTTCATIRNNWGNLTRVDLSMAHEFNNGYPWEVYSGDQANFKTAWDRWWNIVQEELVAYGKNAKVVLSCNSDTNSGWTVANGMPNLAHIDIIGCDMYDMWLGSTNVDTQQKWDDHYMDMKGDTPRGPGAWMAFAASMGKPISFPEWGVSPQPGNGFYVDNPFWVLKMHEMFAANTPSVASALEAGKMAGEAYFNAWDGLGMIWPTANSAANVRDQYVALTWG